MRQIFITLIVCSFGFAKSTFADEPSTQPASLPDTQMLPTTLLTPAAPLGNAFEFFSYGRIGAFTNQSGRQAPILNAVTYEPILEKQPYIEMWFGYNHHFAGLGDFNVMITPAFAGDPFHYTGVFSADFALRNAYAEIRHVGGSGLYAWAGSRMYRGDNIYLLDFWPLDNLNTLGGGLGYEYKGLDVALHAGASRVLGTNYFNQQITVENPTGLGTTTVVTNDRQHLIGSLRLSYYLELPHGFALKAKLYAEAHGIASGAVQLDNNQQQTLPGDSGGVFGGELAGFHTPSQSFLQLFVRQGWDLGAYNALDIPYDLNNSRTTHGAKETMLALGGGAVISDRVTLALGAYYRGFNVAYSTQFDANDRDEYELAARIKVAIFKYWEQGFEGSYQRTLPHGIEPDALRQISPEMGKLSLIPALVNAPAILPEVQIALVYTLTVSNDDAKYLFAPQDVRYSTRTFHYFGIRAEWLFDKVIQ